MYHRPIKELWKSFAWFIGKRWHFKREGVINLNKFIDNNNLLIHIWDYNLSFFGNYTLDVISSCCFGLDIGSSINDPNNEYIKNIKEVFASFIGPKFKLMSKKI